MPYLPFAEMLGQVAEADPDAPPTAASAPRPRAGCAASRAPRSPPEGLDRAEVFEAVHALLDELGEPRRRSCWWSRTPTGPTPAPAT